MSRNLAGMLGPAVGGALVVAGSRASRSVDALVSRLRGDARSDQVAPEPAGGAGGILPRAPGGLAGVHVAHLALGVRDPVRDREPRLLRLDHPRAGDREGGSRRRRRVGDIVAFGGVGAVLGSLIAMRGPPWPPLVACSLWTIPLAGQVLVLVWRRRCGCSRSRRSARARARRAPGALVHALPARDPRADAVARQLLRRPGLVV